MSIKHVGKILVVLIHFTVIRIQFTHFIHHGISYLQFAQQSTITPDTGCREYKMIEIDARKRLTSGTTDLNCSGQIFHVVFYF